MELTKELRFEIWRAFGYDNKFCDIIYDIVERMETTNDEEMYQAIDDSLIYYNSQWTVIEHYFNPSDKEMNWANAMDYLINDIYQVIALINR